MVINKKKNMGSSESKNEAEEPKFPVSNTSIITKHPQRGAKERQREKTAGKVLRHIERVVGSGKSINVQSMIKTLKVATEVALGVVEKLELEGKLIPKDEKGVKVYVVPRKPRLNDLGENENENEEIENELNEEEGEKNLQQEIEQGGLAPRPKKERKSSVLDEIPDLDLTEGVQTRKRKRGNLKIIEQAEEFDEDDREEERSRGRGRPKGSVKRIRGKSERLQERKNSHSKKSPPSSPSDSASDFSAHTSSLITQSKIDDYFLSSHHLERGFNTDDTLPLNGWRVGVPQYRLMALAIQQRVSGCEAYHTQDQHNTFIPHTPSITPLSLKGSSKKASHKSKSHAKKTEDETAKSPSIESIEDQMSVDDGEANERHTARNSHTRNPKKRRNNRFRLTKARRSSRLTEGADLPSERKYLSSVESDDGKNNGNSSSNKSKRKKVETEGRILRSRESTPTKKDKESKETQETSEDEDETDEEDEDEEEEEIELIEVSTDSDDENEGSMNSDNDNEDIESNHERGYKSDRGDRDRENRRNSGSESPVTRGRSRSNSGGNSTKPNMTNTSTNKSSKDDHEGMLLRITPARKTQTQSTSTSSSHSHDTTRTRSKSPLRNVLNNLTSPLRDSIFARLNPKPKNDIDTSRNLRSSSLSTSSTSKPVLKPTLIRLTKPSTKKTTVSTIPRLRPRNITQSKAG